MEPEPDFHGEVAEFYHRYRHGYPAPVIGVLADAFKLGPADLVVDLGCGTGQLTLPVARRVRAVVGLDPEVDMLRRARRAAQDQDVVNVSWILGADTDVPALAHLFGERSVAAITVGQALHWMNHEELFRSAIPLLRAGGGIAVVTNGTPLWLQDTGWSRALRDFLQQWLGVELSFPCGTDEESQLRYREALKAAGFDVSSAAVDYVAELDLDQIVGGVYSALSEDQLPAPDERPGFTGQFRAALGSHEPFREHVHVAILTARLGSDRLVDVDDRPVRKALGLGEMHS